MKTNIRTLITVTLLFALAFVTIFLIGSNMTYATETICRYCGEDCACLKKGIECSVDCRCLLKNTSVSVPSYSSQSASEIISGFDVGADGGIFEEPVKVILGILQYAALAVAIGMMIIIGILYMTKGAGGKADVKSTLLPYFVGAICVSAATTIAMFVMSLGGNG